MSRVACAYASMVLLGSGSGAIGACLDSNDFELTIKNKSLEPIEHLLIDTFQRADVTELHLPPRATVGLCLSKPPVKCKVVYQVAYPDFPPTSYEQDICKRRLIEIKKE